MAEAESSAEATAAEWEEFLRDSARYGDTEDVVQAIAKGVDVDARDEQGNTALHMAAANGHEDIVRLLLSRRARHDSNGSGNTPLHWAAMNARAGVVALLLGRAEGIDVLARNAAGKAPVDLVPEGHDDVLVSMLAHPSAAPLESAGAADGRVGVVVEDGGAEEGAAEHVAHDDSAGEESDEEEPQSRTVGAADETVALGDAGAGAGAGGGSV